MSSDEIEVIKVFIAAINTKNLPELSALMTEDHTFIDSAGSSVTGREKMISAWQSFFKMFPDYEIRVETMLTDGVTVAIFGRSCKTYYGKRGLIPENRIEMPAAWKAIVENGKVKSWQVYADWTAGVKIIEDDNRS